MGRPSKISFFTKEEEKMSSSNAQHDLIAPPVPRPVNSRTQSEMEKGTSQFVEHIGNKRDVVALHDAQLMAGEMTEKVSTVVSLKM